MSDRDGPLHGAFEVSVRRSDPQSAALVLRGELDLASAPTLRNRIAEIAGDGAIHMEYDLADLQFIDSSGIGVLVQDFDRVTRAGGSLVVRNAGSGPMRVFAVTGLVEMLSVSAKEESPPPDAGGDDPGETIG
jgi:anti-sigma B factor antagonist